MPPRPQPAATDALATWPPENGRVLEIKLHRLVRVGLAKSDWMLGAALHVRH